MQSYLSHLMEDIALACREETAEQGPPPEFSMQEHFEEVESWLANNPQHNFSYYCGLTKELFPPANMLNNEQMEELCIAIHKLLYSWNLSAEINLQLPVSKQYTLLVSVLDEKVEIPDYGIVSIEFCNYDPPSCPLQEYCTCREYWNQPETGNDKEDYTGDDIPF